MKILLFSEDEYFVQMFGDFFTKNRIGIELVCYTDEAAAREWLNGAKVELILCDEGYLEEYSQKPNYIALGMSTVMPKENEIGRLNIYQKATRLLEDLDRICTLVCGTKKAVDTSKKSIVVYSTEGGSGKSTIGYLVALTSAKKRKTLYWSLDPLSTPQSLYRQEFKHSMEQILFAQRSTGLQEMLYETVVQNADGVYVLPTVQSFGDYKDIEVRTIEDICGEIYSLGIEWIVLDLPSGVSNFTEELLNESSHIVWVFSDSQRGRDKEGRMRKDPYLKRFLEKSSIVRNLCEKRVDDQEIVAFPYSDTIKKATSVSNVLNVNHDFTQGCQRIEQTIAEN